MSRAPRPRLPTAITRLTSAAQSAQQRVHVHVGDLGELLAERGALITANATLERALERATDHLGRAEAFGAHWRELTIAGLQGWSDCAGALVAAERQSERYVRHLVFIAALAFAAGNLLR